MPSADCSTQDARPGRSNPMSIPMSGWGWTHQGYQGSTGACFFNPRQCLASVHHLSIGDQCSEFCTPAFHFQGGLEKEDESLAKIVAALLELAVPGSCAIEPVAHISTTILAGTLNVQFAQGGWRQDTHPVWKRPPGPLCHKGTLSLASLAVNTQPSRAAVDKCPGPFMTSVETVYALLSAALSVLLAPLRSMKLLRVQVNWPWGPLVASCNHATYTALDTGQDVRLILTLHMWLLSGIHLA